MGESPKKVGRWSDAGLVLLFLGMIGAPAARNLVGPPPPAGNENRYLAPRPVWQWRRAAVEEFPAKFEAYYNDRFGCRGELISALNRAKVAWLRLPSSPQVCLGKHGWLYYVHKPAGMDYEVARPFTDVDLARWQRMLEARRDWLARRGIPYLFVVAPDKQTVYPELLPRELRDRAQGPSRFDQLVGHLRDHSDLRVLDLREPLREAKARERLYGVTDSHWNDRGAHAAYAAMIEALAPSFTRLRPLPREAFADAPVRTAGGDLAQMLGLADRYAEWHLNLQPRVPRCARDVEAGFRVPLPPAMQPQVTERDGPGLPRAVIFRDSFAGNLIGFLSEHFQRVVYLWQEPYEFDAALIERECPEVVIQEIAERKLALPFPPLSRAGIADDWDAGSDARFVTVGPPR
jgi:hypothetical protein